MGGGESVCVTRVCVSETEMRRGRGSTVCKECVTKRTGVCMCLCECVCVVEKMCKCVYVGKTGCV